MSEQPSESEPSPREEESAPETEPKAKPEPSQKKAASDKWDSLKDIAKIIGVWAWLVGLINGIVYILLGLVTVIFGGWGGSVVGLGATAGVTAESVWQIVGGSICIIVSLAFVLPRFSMKCKDEDWDYLLNDVMVLGNFRFPLMLLWGILLSVFGNGWGGIAVFVPAFILLFAGPKPYEWTVQ